MVKKKVNFLALLRAMNKYSRMGKNTDTGKANSKHEISKLKTSSNDQNQNQNDIYRPTAPVMSAMPTRTGGRGLKERGALVKYRLKGNPKLTRVPQYTYPQQQGQ